MLRAAATIAPRAVFVCGNTSTAAGLTVSISRDASGGGKGWQDLSSADKSVRVVFSIITFYEMLLQVAESFASKLAL